MSNESFNPQANTPFKKEAPKTCPTCGQLVHPPVTQLQHIMNNYVNPITGVTICVSSNAAEHIVSGVKMLRQDKYLAMQAKAQTAEPVKTVSTAAGTPVPKAPASTQVATPKTPVATQPVSQTPVVEVTTPTAS